MSDNSRTFLKALYGFDATVARTAPDRWQHRSPCEAWTAADVVAHTVAMNHMTAGFTEGRGVLRPDESHRGDPVETWRTSFERLQEALDREGALQSVAETPWGEMPVDKFLGFVWVDPLIHSWDLAKATGQEPVLDAELVERAYLRLQRAGDSLRGEGRFGPAVAETDGMDPVDRFIAITGRDPGWA